MAWHQDRGWLTVGRKITLALSAAVVAWRLFLCFRTHVLNGWRLSHNWLLPLPSEDSYRLYRVSGWPPSHLTSYFSSKSNEGHITTNGQPARQSRAPWLTFIYLVYFLNTFYTCWFVHEGRPLWREVGSIVFSCCRASPAKSFSRLSPSGLMSIFFCRKFKTPWTCKASFPYLSLSGSR
jgi:hypothetical protein